MKYAILFLFVVALGPCAPWTGYDPPDPQYADGKTFANLDNGDVGSEYELWLNPGFGASGIYVKIPAVCQVLDREQAYGLTGPTNWGWFYKLRCRGKYDWVEGWATEANVRIIP